MQGHLSSPKTDSTKTENGGSMTSQYACTSSASTHLSREMHPPSSSRLSSPSKIMPRRFPHSRSWPRRNAMRKISIPFHAIPNFCSTCTNDPCVLDPTLAHQPCLPTFSINEGFPSILVLVPVLLFSYPMSLWQLNPHLRPPPFPRLLLARANFIVRRVQVDMQT